MRADLGLACGHRPGEPRGNSEWGWRQRGCRRRQDAGRAAEAWRAEAGRAWAQGVVREDAVEAETPAGLWVSHCGGYSLHRGVL